MCCETIGLKFKIFFKRYFDYKIEIYWIINYCSKLCINMIHMKIPFVCIKWHSYNYLYKFGNVFYYLFQLGIITQVAVYLGYDECFDSTTVVSPWLTEQERKSFQAVNTHIMLNNTPEVNQKDLTLWSCDRTTKTHISLRAWCIYAPFIFMKDGSSPKSWLPAEI